MADSLVLIFCFFGVYTEQGRSIKGKESINTKIAAEFQILRSGEYTYANDLTGYNPNLPYLYGLYTKLLFLALQEELILRLRSG